VGEMLDPDTISNAMRAAEIGSLVIGILNANDTINAIDLVIEVFPKDKQQQIRIELSRVLEAILSQRLVARINGGRVAAFETLIVDKKVRELIRLGKVIQISENGCIQSMNKALDELVKSGIISQEEAVGCSSDSEQLQETLLWT
jgi:twitching motility protein PilT